MSGTIQRADIVEIDPTIIAQEALTVLTAELNLVRNVTKDSELVPESQRGAVKGGSTISVPKTGTVVAHQKAEGGDVLIQNPGMDKVDITLDQHWEVTISPEDYAQAVADRNIQDTYLGDMVRALAEKMESVTAAVIDTFDEEIDATAGIDEDDILAARKFLTNNRAPMAGRFGYLESGAINKLLKIDRFTEVAKYGSGAPIQTGELGTIHGFRTFESIFVPSAGSPTTYSNVLMHRRAIVLATRPLPKPRGPGVEVAVVTDPVSGITMRALYSYNANKLGDQLTLDVLFGVGKLREELAVRVLTR